MTVWNWPDCVSSSSEFLLIHQIGLIYYNEVSHSNLPAKILNAYHCGVFLCVCLCVFNEFSWVAAGNTCSNGSRALFSLEVKTQTKSRNAKGCTTGLSSSRVFAEQQQTHSCWRTQTETPGETDRRVAKSTVNSYEAMCGAYWVSVTLKTYLFPFWTVWWSIESGTRTPLKSRGLLGREELHSEVH